MELWVRSQDKRILQKVDNVYLNANYENRRICTNDSRDYESELGTYETKERALEVLDEIHSCLQTNAGFDIYSKLGMFANDYNKKYNLVPVYQMPIE